MIKNKLETAQKFVMIYNLLHGLIYICAICITTPFLAPLFSSRRPGEEIIGLMIFIFISAFYLVFIVTHFALAFLARKKSKAVYILEIVSLIFGFWDPIFVIPAVILTVLMIDPEVREYYMD
jgi:hypothetical protein